MHKIARTALQTLDVRNSLCFFSSNPFCPTVSNPTEAKSSGGEEVKKNRPVLHPLVVPKPWVWPELRAREEPNLDEGLEYLLRFSKSLKFALNTMDPAQANNSQS